MNHETNTSHRVEPVWLITANVIAEQPFGEGGLEIKSGTKHFRANAKVYIIDAYGGLCESVTVIGHHRASGRFAKLDLKVKRLENLRMTLCYSPKVIELTTDHWDVIPNKDEMEAKLELIRSWPD